MKGVIIQGSSRSDGNTNKIVQYLQKELGFDFIDLKTKQIGHYDYQFNNQQDDFLPLIRDIANNYQILLFATPIYWYTMSGILKVFFDRISDCLKIEKPTGRKLRGKYMAVVSCGSNEELKEGFAMPFVESADYLGMHYLSDVHGWIDDGEIPIVVKKDMGKFITLIKEVVKPYN